MLLPRLLRAPSARPFVQANNVYLARNRLRTLSTSQRFLEQLAEDATPKLPDIDPSKLDVTKTITPKELVPNQDLVFGRTFTGP